MTQQQLSVTFNDLSVPYIRAVIGSGLIALSLYATISFMSQGFSGLAFLSVVVFCLSIEVVKILSAGDIGFYLALHKVEKAILAAVIVSILVILSIGAETWFLVSGSLKEATLIEQSSGQTAALQTRISDKQTQLAACNPTSLSKCVNPRTAELEALQTELATITAAGSSSVAQTEAKANAKFWSQAAAATGTTPENLLLGINIVRAILQELFGVYFLGQYSTWKRLNKLQAQGFQPQQVEERVVNPAPAPAPMAAPIAAPLPVPTPVSVPRTNQFPPKPRAAAQRTQGDALTRREEQKLFVSRIRTLEKENAAIKSNNLFKAAQGVSDFSPESSIFEKPTKHSAFDLSKLSLK